GVAKPPHSPASLSASRSSFSRPYALSLVSVIPNGSLPISGSYPFGFVVIAPLFAEIDLASFAQVGFRLVHYRTLSS
ncbi:hypothetical protein K6U17_12955, partial [Vibrio fluvialis]|uniref:hypothetical protein n=1 Tax=Vibrio fluvialis TaxID=676 RepID=UPI001EEBEEA2